MARMGANGVRISFVEPQMFQEDGELNPSAYQVLDRYISWSKDTNIALVVDLHTFPGAKKKYSGSREDLVWSNPELKVKILDGFKKLYDRYKDESQIVAYDLANEQELPENKDRDYLEFLRANLVELERLDKTGKVAMVQPPISKDFRGIARAQYKSWNSIVGILGTRAIGTLHYYDPGNYTHQGLLGFPPNSALPTSISNRKDMTAYFSKGLDQIQTPPGSTIMVGEFSVSNFAPPDSELYLETLIRYFNSRKWAWFYHAYKESKIWDPSYVQDAGGQLVRVTMTKRMEILTRGFKEFQSACDK
jgi:hypothetical protein